MIEMVDRILMFELIVFVVVSTLAVWPLFVILRDSIRSRRQIARWQRLAEIVADESRTDGERIAAFATLLKD